MEGTDSSVVEADTAVRFLSDTMGLMTWRVDKSERLHQQGTVEKHLEKIARILNEPTISLSYDIQPGVGARLSE